MLQRIFKEAEPTKQIKHEYYKAKDQVTNIFTKVMSRTKFKLPWTKFGVTEICIKEKC